MLPSWRTSAIETVWNYLIFMVIKCIVCVYCINHSLLCLSFVIGNTWWSNVVDFYRRKNCHLWSFSSDFAGWTVVYSVPWRPGKFTRALWLVLTWKYLDIRALAPNEIIALCFCLRLRRHVLILPDCDSTSMWDWKKFMQSEKNSQIRGSPPP